MRIVQYTPSGRTKRGTELEFSLFQPNRGGVYAQASGVTINRNPYEIKLTWDDIRKLLELWEAEIARRGALDADYWDGFAP